MAIDPIATAPFAIQNPVPQLPQAAKERPVIEESQASSTVTEQPPLLSPETGTTQSPLVVLDNELNSQEISRQFEFERILADAIQREELSAELRLATASAPLPFQRVIIFGSLMLDIPA
jgi:hypothetical protein